MAAILVFCVTYAFQGKGVDAAPRGGGTCPEPPGVIQLCGPLAAVDCLGGAAGDECWPLVVGVNLDGTLRAESCTCAGPGTSCGPVVVLNDPVAGVLFACESLCPAPADACEIYVNSVSTGASTAFLVNLNLGAGDTVTCECPTPPSSYENWVIADDFCVKGCDRCQCDVNGDNLCNPDDIQFWNLCSVPNINPACVAADVNCDNMIDQADLIIIDCMVAGGTQAECCPGAGKIIDRLRWYGSYFDPDFEPGDTGLPPLRRPDSWLIGLHTNIPEVTCPPVPAGTKPVDWCGTVEDCPNGLGRVFRPDGSAFAYNLFDPSNLLGGFAVGDQVRLCGHDNNNIHGLCSDALFPVVEVDAVANCRSKVSRPDRLIAQWVLPDPLVTVDPTSLTGWDTHRVFCYTADLPNACLVHDFSQPGEIDPITGAIHPIPGKTYWLSIQAAVGHTVDLATCQEVQTGQTVDREWWGWHTTPPGHQHKDDAYMGSLAMTCDDGWLYNWMGHLHSSQPDFLECADDPTKSVDMAFYLIDADRFCGGDTSQPCQTDADCPVGGSTCDTTEVVHWCQPIRPGQPTTPGPVEVFPYGQIDELSTTIADVAVNLDFFPQTLNLNLQGPMVVWRGIEHEDIGGASAARVIETEILSMDLSGFDPAIGPVTLRVTPLGSSGQDGVRSTGQIKGGSRGSDFPADSFFDVFFEIDVPAGPTGAPLVLVGVEPLRMRAQIWEIPPSNVEYQSDPVPVELRDRATGQIVGTVKAVVHFVPYKGGVNVHSDVDWANTPVEPCCEPLDDGTDCEQTVCPDPDEECVPVEWECRSTCLGTVISCNTDADCLDFCVETCRVTDCDCRLPDECHAVQDTTVFGPISCKGPCPNGQVCERIEIDTDTPPDGIPDKYRCDCDEHDPLLCPLVDPTDPDDPCVNLQATDCITSVFGNKQCRPRFVTSTTTPGLIVDRCECFDIDTDKCGPIDVDLLTGDVSCTGVCPPFTPGDCLVFANGVSLGRPTANVSDPDIPPGANLKCDCQPTPPEGACCFDADSDGIAETCIITTPTDCANRQGTFHGTGTFCGVVGACCIDADGDGVTELCHEMDSTCCEDVNGTFLGAGSICEGDLNGNGVDDACDCDTIVGERIVLRSGNGLVGGPDTAIRVLPGPAAGPVSPWPFTPVDFFHACVLPPASVIAPNPAWLAGSGGSLPADPLAQWIGPNPNSAVNSPASGLFCQEFDVCCPNFSTATITISFAADDQIGDAPFGPNNIGVYINGSPVPGFLGVGFGSQIVLTGPVGGTLTTGTNQLHVYLRDVWAVASGLIYSVTIDVDCDLEACCFPDGRCEDLDPCCCRDLGGTPQGAGSDCTTVDCGDPDLCPLPSAAGVVDPCDALQATDCQTTDPDQLCLPVCTKTTAIVDFQGNVTIVPIATECTCFDDSGACGPVKIETNAGISEFVCDPKFCPDPVDFCQIHVNGSPIGVDRIATSAVTVGAEVKCKCAGDMPDPCPTPLPTSIDPCGALQTTDCTDGVAGELCVPICMEAFQDATGLNQRATVCDCVSGDECGPVNVVDDGIVKEFVCDPTVCLIANEECRIHLNGLPFAASSIATNLVAPGVEVKCRCTSVIDDTCPTPLPTSSDPCGLLQATDCINGAAGDLCLPICVEMIQDATGFTPTATACDCIGGDECGPVRFVDTGGVTELVCDPTACPVPLDLCQIHLNGSPTGSANINAGSIAPGTEVKCKCGPPDIIDDPCPTPLPPAMDPCGALQAADCKDGVAGDLCLPVCTQTTLSTDGTVIAVATECTCFDDSGSCGPVKIETTGTVTEFVCDPKFCLDPVDFCQIHVNGSPTGVDRVDVTTVALDSEVKCRCASDIGDPCPTPLPSTLDPCGALQTTDCIDGVAGEVCLPICIEIVQDATGLTPTATACDCIGDDECGPVRIVDTGVTTDLVCNPTACPDPLDLCQIHLNGSPTGAANIDADGIAPGTEVKCKCGPPDVIDDPCPTPLPPAIDPCGALQAVDCIDGVSGERCVPICVEISQDATGLVPTATKCDCKDGTECGPVVITQDPAVGFNLSCNPSVCPGAGVSCVVHINGVAFGPSVDVSSLVPADEVKCRCPSLIATPALPGRVNGVDHDILKNRFISVNPNNATAVSLRVELLDQACSVTGIRCNTAADCKACVGGANNGSGCIISSDCPGGTCTQTVESCDPQSAPVLLGWMSDPVQAGGDALPGTFTSEVVTPRPAPRIWTQPVIHVGDCEIAPVRTYAISATTDGVVFSGRLVLATINKPQGKFWGDLVGNFNGFFWSGPNGLVGVDDVNAMIKFLSLAPFAPHVTVVDLVGGPTRYLNFDANVADLQMVLEAFGAGTWPPLAVTAVGYPANGDVTLCP